MSVLRLITNAIPPEALQMQATGDVRHLPTAYQWSGLVLLEEELALLSGTDRQCFFYVFRLPRAW